MDADRIIEALDTLKLGDLRRVRVELERMIARVESWQRPPAEVGPNPDLEYYRPELVKCGKADCKKCAGGGGHGPYWYRFYRQEGKLRKQYIGKNLPAQLAAELTPKGGGPTLVRK